MAWLGWWWWVVVVVMVVVVVVAAVAADGGREEGDGWAGPAPARPQASALCAVCCVLRSACGASGKEGGGGCC